MHRSATRPLSLLVVAAAIAIAVAAPAQAYTPPIGSDKGSVTDSPATFTKDYDMASPYLKSDPVHDGAASVSSSAKSPDANGIIAILIG
jgi:type VI protein secretion system component Hcp